MSDEVKGAAVPTSSGQAGAKSSFAELFAKESVSSRKQPAPRVGEEMNGKVAVVTKDSVFVDLGFKLQGYFERTEFGDNPPAVGETVRGFVAAIDRSEEGAQVKLAARVGRGEANAEVLRGAFEQQVPVEGKVTGVVKGGVTVEVGGLRGFCPASQLDDHFVQDLSQYLLRTLTFLITKLESKDVVLSRRALLEKSSKDAEEKALSQLSIGSVHKGRVTQVRDFGAFVEVGGLVGLVPSRELSHDRARPEDVVKVDDVVEVQVLSVQKVEAKDPKRGPRTEITLSLKSLAKDPWDGIEVLFTPGKVVAGQVSRLAEFGAFVRLAPGVEGLIHVSEFGGNAKHPQDATFVGANVTARVTNVDPAKKRIGLALASSGASVGSIEEGFRMVQSAVVKAVVEKVENYGLVVQVQGTQGKAGRGTVPTSETGTKPGSDLRKLFPAGMEIVAKVIDTAGGRNRLSIRQAVNDAERAEFDAYRQDQKAKAGMGTLGDLLARAKKS